MIYRVRIDDLMDPSYLELYEKVNGAAHFTETKNLSFMSITQHIFFSHFFQLGCVNSYRTGFPLKVLFHVLLY